MISHSEQGILRPRKRAINQRQRRMSLHPDFPSSPYEPLIPDQRWFPADEALRSTAYEKLLPPLVAKVREEVFVWRAKGYASASATSAALLRHWFESDHLVENADGSLSPFRYYFAQREAVETVICSDSTRPARSRPTATSPPIRRTLSSAPSTAQSGSSRPRDERSWICRRKWRGSSCGVPTRRLPNRTDGGTTSSSWIN